MRLLGTLRVLLVFPLALAFSTVTLSAGARSELEKKKQAQEQLRQKIRDDKKKGEQIRRRERSILLDLQKFDRRIDKYNTEIGDSRSRIKRSEKRIAVVRTDLGMLAEALDESQGRLGRRLRQMYKSGKTSNINYLLRAEGPADFQRRLRYVKSVAAADAELIRGTRDHARALSEKKLELEMEVAALARSKQSLERSRGQMVKERKNKQALASRVKNDRLLLERSLEEKKARAAELDMMIAGLYRKKDQQERTARLGASEFGKKKGYLPWPVRGKVIHFFGRRKYAGIRAYSECAGIKIKAARGAPIRSVAGGRVLYADWYTGYGKMVVVDHGGGYGSIYTHASELEVAKGQAVAAGSVVARVGSTESLSGDMLYFQIRHYGKAVNPLPWLEGR